MTKTDDIILKSIKSIIKKNIYIIFIVTVVIITAIIKIEIIRANAAREIKEQRAEILHIKDGYDTSLIISIKDVRRKVSAFTTEVLATYGFKYHPKKLKAMNKEQKELWIRKNIEFAELLNYGYYDLTAIALIESEFNPYAEGKYQDERSMFQMSPPAVSEACKYYRQLPDELKETFAFKYDDHNEDLKDPINSLKIASVLYWGLLKDYGRQLDWVLTFYHFGTTSVYKWYKINIFPEAFIFNSGTKRESKQSVIGYFNTWYSITQKFKKGNIEIQKELDYWKDIRRRMTLPELKLTESYKVIKKLRNLLNEVQDLDLDYNKGMKEYFKKVRKEVQATDRKYKKIFKGVRTGNFEKFRKISKYMLQSDSIFKSFRDQVYKEDQWQFWTLFIIGISILLIFAGILVFIIIYFVKRLKNRDIKTNQKL